MLEVLNGFTVGLNGKLIDMVRKKKKYSRVKIKREVFTNEMVMNSKYNFIEIFGVDKNP